MKENEYYELFMSGPDADADALENDDETVDPVTGEVLDADDDEDEDAEIDEASDEKADDDE